MTTLTEKFTALEEQVATQDAAMQVDLNAIREALGLLNDQIDTLNINGAANTRAILLAIGQNSPCSPCPTPPIIIPVTDPTEQPIDTDKCKRVQAFLHAMQEVFTVLDVASSVGIGFNPTVIVDAWNQVITALANGDETPVISFPEAVQLGGSLINYAAYNFLVGGTLSASFATLIPELKDAIYSAASPSAGQSIYNDLIDASELHSTVKAVLKDAAYNALWSYYFDPATDPNLTGYGGTECTPAGCFEFDSETACTGGFCRQYIVWLPPLTGVTNLGGTTWDKDVLLIDDLFGWQITNTGVSAKRFVYNVTGGSQVVDFIEPDTPLVMEVHTDVALVDDSFSDGAFSIRLCSPGSF